MVAINQRESAFVGSAALPLIVAPWGRGWTSPLSALQRNLLERVSTPYMVAAYYVYGQFARNINGAGLTSIEVDGTCHAF
jgi:hypothetical protein